MRLAMVKDTNAACKKFQMPHSAIKMHENLKSPYRLAGEQVGPAVKRLNENQMGRWLEPGHQLGTLQLRAEDQEVAGCTSGVPGNIIQEPLSKTLNCSRGRCRPGVCSQQTTNSVISKIQGEISSSFLHTSGYRRK